MNKEQLLQMAINTVNVDKISVIPVGKNKIPLIKWTEFQKRFATEDEIKGWFEMFPEAQIGFVTGKISNLSVVDVEAEGDWSWLPQDTFIVKTGGGGRHYYFKYQEGLKNKARIRPFTDVRSEGGMVVAPGSCSDKGNYEVIKKMEPALFPRELLVASPETNNATKISVPSSQPTGTLDEIASDSFFLLASYSGFGVGQRNEEMTSFIGKVLNRINPIHWSSHGWEIINKANAKNTPPLPLNELMNSYNSIRKREAEKTPILTSKNNTPLFVPVLDGSDEVKHIKIVAGEQKMDSLEVFPTQMQIFDDALRGGFRLGNVVIVAAPTGQGKTSLCQDWTLSFTRGEKKIPVLWFSYEVMVADLWENFKEMGMSEEDIAVIPAKHTSGNIAWVESKIKEAKEKFGIKVVMIDHLGFLLPKTMGVLGKNMSMNQASFVTQTVRDLKTLAIQEEVIIILPVHVAKIKGKNRVDQEDIKDSSGIAQEADCVFLLEREKNTNTNIKEYFTENTKITLSKNRKFGSTPFGLFTMINRRFASSEINEMQKKADDDFDDFEGKKVEINPDNLKF